MTRFRKDANDFLHKAGINLMYEKLIRAAILNNDGVDFACLVLGLPVI